MTHKRLTLSSAVKKNKKEKSSLLQCNAIFLRVHTLLMKRSDGFKKT